MPVPMPKPTFEPPLIALTVTTVPPISHALGASCAFPALRLSFASTSQLDEPNLLVLHAVVANTTITSIRFIGFSSRGFL
jgi:hypothetical protein